MSSDGYSYEDPKPDPEIYALLDSTRQAREYQGLPSSTSTSNNEGSRDGTNQGNDTAAVFVPVPQQPSMQPPFPVPSANGYQQPGSLSGPLHTGRTPAVGRNAGYPHGIPHPGGGPTRDEVQYPMGHPLSRLYPPLDGPAPAAPAPINPVAPAHHGYGPPNPYLAYQPRPMLHQPGQMNAPAGFVYNQPGNMAPPPAAPVIHPYGGYPPQIAFPPNHGYGTNMPAQIPQAPARNTGVATGPASTTPAVQPATLVNPKNFSSWRGYPAKGTIPAPGLSCYEVCQRYPNSLHHGVLDAFLQRNWSAGEVVQSLPDGIRATLGDAQPAYNPTWLTNRMNKRKDVLMSQNRWDPMIRDARAGRFIRADDRPHDIKRWKSAQPAEFASSLRSNHDTLVSRRAAAASRRSRRVAAQADAGSADSGEGGSSSYTDADAQVELGEEGEQNGDRMDIDETESEDAQDDEDEDPDWGA